MVTLNTAYGLCSLIEQGGFVYACEDEEGCACVTLGKNIAIRYRLVDQKQLNSWSTIPPFTSQVTYDPVKSEYLAIFNENVVKRWRIEDTNLDKVPRIKLKDAGHCILLDDEPLVVFKSGACCTLSYLADKKHEQVKGFLSEQNVIVAVRSFTVAQQKYLVLVASTGGKTLAGYCVKLYGNSLQPELATLHIMKFRKRGHSVVSCCFVTRDSGEYIVTLWSDGFIYLLPLPWTKADESLGIFTGMVRSVSTSSPASMTCLSSNHIALYGADPSDEGAVLAVYNLDFGMVQASSTFKFLTKPPRLWVTHDRLLLSFGQRLLCVPYSLETGSVSALVGSRPLTTEARTSDLMAVVPSVNWEKEVPPAASSPIKESTIDLKVKKEIDNFAAQGMCESGIFEALVNHYLEKQNVPKLYWCLDNFVDIPEHLTVRLLHFAFSYPEDKFREVELTPSKTEPPLVNGCSPKGAKCKRKRSKSNHVNGVNGVSSELVPDAGLTEDCPLFPAARAAFVDRLLNVPSNKDALVPALRTGLSTAECLNILQYLSYFMSSNSRGLSQNIIDWVTTVTDAFYQQLLLGRHSECVESVLKLKEQVTQQIGFLNELKDLLPKVVRLKSKKNTSRNPLQLKSYSIQNIQIYQ